MPKIILDFNTKQDADAFYAYFMDGGGYDGWLDAVALEGDVLETTECRVKKDYK
jgi:hypothetical protein